MNLALAHLQKAYKLADHLPKLDDAPFADPIAYEALRCLALVART